MDPVYLPTDWTPMKIICARCDSEVLPDQTSLLLAGTRYRSWPCTMHLECFRDYARDRAESDREANELLLSGKPLTLNQVAALIGCPRNTLAKRLRSVGILADQGRGAAPGKGWEHLFEVREVSRYDKVRGHTVYEQPLLLPEWYPLVVKVWSEAG